MILDKKMQYADSEALSASGNSVDTLDHSLDDAAIGLGEPLTVLVSLESVADAGDANETYEVFLQTDNDSGFGAAEEVVRIPIPAGSPAGSKFYIPVPPNIRMKRYSRLEYILGGTTPSVTLSAYLIPRSFSEQKKDHPIGYSVAP